MVTFDNAINCISNGLALAMHDHGGDNEWLMRCFEVCVESVLLEAFVGDFSVFAGKARDISWKAVHVESIVCGGHHFVITLPTHELLV